jgi:uncharacterized membrane protein YjgN (DUF898 family)
MGFFSIKKIPYEELNPFFQYLRDHLIFLDIFTWFIVWIWGMSIIGGLFYKLKTLWPSIEFDFGPEHFKKEKRTRKTMWIVLSLIIIPLVLQIIFSIFTK